MSCTRADAFFAKRGLTAGLVVDAKKQPIDARAGLAHVKKMARLVVMRGAKSVAFDLAKDRPSDADILALITGPTGNLRAPSLKIGSTMLVGFNEAAYAAALD